MVRVCHQLPEKTELVMQKTSARARVVLHMAHAPVAMEFVVCVRTKHFKYGSYINAKK